MTDTHAAALPGWHLHRIATSTGSLAVAEYCGVVACGVVACDAEPLVLLHGFTGSHRSWDAVVPALASIGRCVAVDLPGHGESDFEADAGAYSMESASTALASSLDALRVGPATLIGYSMGGRLALYFALTRPERVRRLVLESASPGLATEAEREARRRSDEALARFALITASRRSSTAGSRCRHCGPNDAFRPTPVCVYARNDCAAHRRVWRPACAGWARAASRGSATGSAAQQCRCCWSPARMIRSSSRLRSP